MIESQYSSPAGTQPRSPYMRARLRQRAVSPTTQIRRLVPPLAPASVPLRARPLLIAHTVAAPLSHAGLHILVLNTAIVLGWSVDYLFYHKPLGISVPIFTALFVGVLLALARREGIRPSARNAWLVLPALFFACMSAVRANPLLTALNLGTVVLLLCLFIGLYAGPSIARLGLLGYPMTLLVAARAALTSAAPAARLYAQAASSRRA